MKQSLWHCTLSCNISIACRVTVCKYAKSRPQAPWLNTHRVSRAPPVDRNLPERQEAAGELASLHLQGGVSPARCDTHFATHTLPAPPYLWLGLRPFSPTQQQHQDCHRKTFNFYFLCLLRRFSSNPSHLGLAECILCIYKRLIHLNRARTGCRTQIIGTNLDYILGFVHLSQQTRCRPLQPWPRIV